MFDPDTLPLIAQNEHTEHPAEGDTPNVGKPAGEHADQEGSGNVFSQLLSQLGDHHELSFGPWLHIPLPYILIDNGLHVYATEHSLEAGGVFKLDHATHHVVSVETGKPPAFDMSVTSLIAFQWIAMLLLLAIFVPMGRKYRSGNVKPLKGFHNAMEALVVYVRDEIVMPNTGANGARLMPIFLTFFFFILTMNLMGLIPFGHAPTGSLAVTAGLAIIAFFTIQIAAILKNGLRSWLYHLTGGVPVWLWPIMVPVEVLGLFTKPFALCVRLFANMTAGHVILLSLIGLVFITSAFIPVTIGFSLFISILEILVAVIQAYIFTVLTAVFTGMGMASSHDNDHDTAHASTH